jgi:hypothetical protein
MERDLFDYSDGLLGPRIGQVRRASPRAAIGRKGIRE